MKLNQEDANVWDGHYDCQKAPKLQTAAQVGMEDKVPKINPKPSTLDPKPNEVTRTA